MKRCCGLFLFISAAFGAEGDPAAVLEQFRSQLRDTLKQLPDYTCLQTIERARRPSESVAFQPLDSIRVQVGLIGQNERYSWPDAKKFEDKELRELVGKGVVSTGNFALHVKHVFLSPATRFTLRGDGDAAGQSAVRFDYELPVEHSRYTLRFPPHEEEVGVRGSFALDPRTLDLVRLEVIADEVSPDLGIQAIRHIIDYARTPIGDGEFLLPRKASLSLVDLNGEEHRNDSVFAECRQYRAESRLKFDSDEAEIAEAPAPGPAPVASLPAKLTVEVNLVHDIDPAGAALGDAVTAAVAKPVVHSGTTLMAAGWALHGRLVRLEKEATPFPHYVVGIEFHTAKSADGAESFDFSATMHDAGPASGLIRQTRRMDPIFTKRRQKRFDILVREKPRGEGVLHWDAKKARVPKGLRMVWETIEDR
ncbi:MAG: hypothetical protein R2729_29515 [Bryobacteraceae bacterium]